MKIKCWSKPASIIFSILFIAILCFSFLPIPVQIGQFGAGVASASTIQTIYTSNSTFAVPSTVTTLTVLIVAGGGGGAGGDQYGWGGGGGGAGGVIFWNGNYTVTPGNNITIVIGNYGAGGAKNSAGNQGGNSSISGDGSTTLPAVGGGAGGYTAGGNGGSGGGSFYNDIAGTGVSGQGNDGGVGTLHATYGGAGGGGGNGAVGTGTSNANGGAGGIGGNYSSYFPGLNFGDTSTGYNGYVAGGGGGGPATTNTAGAGGKGGGGAGGRNAAGNPATANTGGGGGGGGETSVCCAGTVSYAGGNGGTGVVIISYVQLVITTIAATEVTTISAILNGNITSLGSGNVTSYGFVLSTSTQSNPGNVSPSAQTTYTSGDWTWSGVNYEAGQLLNSNGNVTGLSSNTWYYFRAGVYNTLGWSWGSELYFCTLNPGEPSEWLTYGGTFFNYKRSLSINTINPVATNYKIPIDVYAGNPTVEVGTWTVNSKTAHARIGFPVQTFDALPAGYPIYFMIDTATMVTAGLVAGSGAGNATTIEFADVNGNNSMYYWCTTSAGTPINFNTSGTRYFVAMPALDANSTYTEYLYCDPLWTTSSSYYSGSHTFADGGGFFEDFNAPAANLAAFLTAYPKWEQDPTAHTPTVSVAAGSSILTLTGTQAIEWTGVATKVDGNGFYAQNWRSYFRASSTIGANAAFGMFDNAGIGATSHKDGLWYQPTGYWEYALDVPETNASPIPFGAIMTAPFTAFMTKYGARYISAQSWTDNNASPDVSQGYAPATDEDHKVFVASYQTNTVYLDWIAVAPETERPPVCVFPDITYAAKAGTIFCNNHMEHWPYDIAFTLGDGDTQLYYYTDTLVQLTKQPGQSFQTTVRIPGSLGENQTICVYYGNDNITSPTAYYSGNNTYQDTGNKFEDFSDVADWTAISGTWSNPAVLEPVLSQGDVGNVPGGAGRLWARFPGVVKVADNNYKMIFCNTLWETSEQYWPNPYRTYMASTTSLGTSFSPAVNIKVLPQYGDYRPGAWPTAAKVYNSKIYVLETIPNGFKLVYSEDGGVTWIENPNGPFLTAAWMQANDGGSTWDAATYVMTYEFTYNAADSNYYIFCSGSDLNKIGCVHTAVLPEDWKTTDFVYDGLVLTTTNYSEDGDLAYDGSRYWYYAQVTLQADTTFKMTYWTLDTWAFAFPGLTHWAGGQYGTAISYTAFPLDGTTRSPRFLLDNGTWYLYFSAMGVPESSSDYAHKWVPNYIVCQTSATLNGTFALANTDVKYKQATATGTQQAYITTPTYTDFDVISEVMLGQSGKTAVGITFRGDGTANNYYVAWLNYNTAVPLVSLHKVVAGAHTALGEDVSIPNFPSPQLNPGYSWRLRVAAYGSHIIVYYSPWGNQWVKAFDLTDTTYTSGKIGVFTYIAEGYFDNLRIRDLTLTEPIVGTAAESLPPCPIIDTLAATSIGETTATINGNITELLVPSNIISRGFVWDTSSHGNQTNPPASSDYVATGGYYTEDGDWGEETFHYDMTGLPEGTCIYYRAWGNTAPCTEGTYGNESVFETLLGEPTNLTTTHRTDNHIDIEWTKGGSGNTTVRYSTTDYPADSNSGTGVYNGTGNITTINESAGQAIYIRAWSIIVSCSGTKQSNNYAQLLDYTLPGNITSINAYNPQNTSIDLSWTKGGGGDKTLIRGKIGSYPGNVTDGIEVYFDTGSSTTHSSIGDCEDWYYSAWAYDSDSGYYSEGYNTDHQESLCITPTVVTTAASSVVSTSATLNGNITATGSSNEQAYAFVYGTESHSAPAGIPPGDYEGNWTSGAGSYGVGAYNSDAHVTGLTEGTLYYFRFGGNNTAGWTWGDQLTFYTNPGDVSNLNAFNPQNTSIDLSWTNGTNADKTLIRGKQGSYPVNIADGIQIYFDTGTSTTHSGIGDCETWYYRAWGYDSDSGQYSDSYVQDSQATPCIAPTVITTDASSVEETTATINGNITATGSSNEKYYAFIWSTSTHTAPVGAPPGSYEGNWTSVLGNYTAGAYNHAISSLTKGELYYFRFGGNNTADWSWGDEFTFLTKPDAPTALNITSTTSTSVDLTWTKGTGAQKTMIRYSTSGYPTDHTGGDGSTEAYFDTGTGTTVTPLSSGQIYYFTAWSYATEGGLEQYSDLTSEDSDYTLPSDPSNLDAHNPTGVSIDLEWTMGIGGNITVVVGKEGDYPLDPGEGTVIYNGTGNSTTHAGLEDCETWFYRAWNYDAESGEYSAGYSEDTQGTTCVEPTVVTDAATLVEETTTTLNGSVSDVGSSNIKYYGYVWGTTSQVAPAGNPTTGLYDYNWTSALGNWTAGAFSHNITTLVEGELYYSRFGAKNNSPNWGWGDETIFLTKPLEPTGCSITQGDTHLELSWTKPASADKTVIVRKEGSYPTNKTDGAEVYNNTGTYYDDVGLTNAHHYYYRMWSWATEGGLEQYSDAYCDTNGIPQPIPVLTTDAASLVEEITATLNGTITNDNGGVLERGFDWDTDTSGAPYSFTYTNIGTYGNGSFDHAVASLPEGTCVYYRAKARNLTGWGYGSESIFQTKPDEPTGLADTAHTSASITLGWTNGDGTDSVIIRYKTTAYPTDYADGTSAYSGAGVSTIVSLPTTGQVYYFRMWSISVCEGITQYSDTYSQHTAYTSPSDPTGFNAHDPTSTSILLDWTKGVNGDKTLIVAKIGDYPANTGDGTQIYYDTGDSFAHVTAGCDAHNKHWYYRAWSYDSDSGYFSDSYSQDNETTLKDLPTVTNGVGVTGITNTSARLNGELTCNGGDTTTVHIYWGDNNGGTTAVNWDNDVNFGATPIGTFYIDLDTLSEGIIYYYRTYSVNSMGGDWADETISFLTVCLPPVDLTATYVSTYEIDLAWTPGVAGGKTVIQGAINAAPATADDGFPAYNGYGNSTKFYMNTNCIIGNITFRGWGLCTSEYSGNYTETHIHVANTCGGGGNYTGNYTVTCDVIDCDPPTNLVATLLTPDTVSLTWTPGNATSITVIKVQVGVPPANPYEGDLLYRGPGKSTVCSIPTDFVGDTLKFRAWTVCCPWIGY